MAIKVGVELDFQRTNIKPIVNDVQRQLQGIEGTISLKVDRSAVSQVGALNQRLQSLNKILEETAIKGLAASASIEKLSNAFNNSLRDSSALARNTGGVVRSMQQVKESTEQASNSFQSFGRSIQLSAKRFAAFTIGAGALIGFVRSLEGGVRGAIEFQKEMVRLAQVAEEPTSALKGIQNEITKLSTALGVSSTDLAKSAVTLKQAGLSLKDVNTSLEAIAEASLAPNFKDMNEIVEGSISIFSQFGTKAEDLKGILGSLNAVAGAFAVESSDLVTLVRKTGGAFKSVGGDLNELVALFTSVRATTRESADSIATGFRTIFGRLQRPETIEDLKQLGVELRFTRDEAEQLGNVNLTGQFVGAFESVRRLSTALRDIPTTDERFAQVVESIGGIRQISKVIPLIQQFGVANKALAVGLSGTESLSRSTALAQESLTVKVTKLQEAFSALFRSIADSSGFRSFVDTIVVLGTSLAKVLDFVKPLVPLLTTLAAVKIASNIGDLARGARLFGSAPTASAAATVPPKKFAGGGFVPGNGNGDSVPAMLEPGEFVLRKSAVQNLQKQGVNPQHLATGGTIKKRGKVLDINPPGGRVGVLIPNTGFSESKRLTLGVQDMGPGSVSALKGLSPDAIGASVPVIVKGPKPGQAVGIKDAISKGLIKTAADIGQNVLADPPKFTFSSQDADRIAKNTIGDNARGQIFEAILQTIVSRGGGNVPSSGNDPFDFSPVNSKGLDSLYGVGGIFADAKISGSTNNVNSVVGKAVRQFSRDDVGFKAGLKDRTIKIDAGKGKFANKNIGKAFGGMIRRFASGGSVPKGLSRESFLNAIETTNAADMVSRAPLDLVQGIPEGSQILGSGQEAVAFRGPNGNVFRLGVLQSELEQSKNLFRPDNKNVLQPFSSKRSGNFILEELPFAPDITRSGISEDRQAFIANALGKRLVKQGFLPTDVIPQNIGRSQEGKFKLIDPSTFKLPETELEKLKLQKLQKKAGVFSTALSGPSKKWFGGSIFSRFAKGGEASDNVPALLTPGEFVINRETAEKIGPARLNKLNQGEVQGFAKGGLVGLARGGFPSGGDNLSGNFEAIVNRQISALKENTQAVLQTSKALITPSNSNSPLSTNVLDDSGLVPLNAINRKNIGPTLPTIPVETGPSVNLQDFGRNNDFASGPSESDKQERLARIFEASERRAGKTLGPILPRGSGDFTDDSNLTSPAIALTNKKIVLSGDKFAESLRAAGREDLIKPVKDTFSRIRQAGGKLANALEVNIATGEIRNLNAGKLERFQGAVGRGASAVGNGLAAGGSFLRSTFGRKDEEVANLGQREKNIASNRRRDQVQFTALLGAGIATEITSLISDKVGPATGSSGTGFKTARGLSGAASGAAQGAALGSLAGPVGIAIGGVAGGLLGLTTSLKEAEKEISAIKIDEALTSLNTKLTNFEFKTGSSDFKDVLSDITNTRSQIDKTVGLDETVGTKAFFDARQKKTTEVLGPAAAGLTQALLKNVEDIGTSFKGLDAAGNSEKAQREAIAAEIARANPEFKALTQEISSLSKQSVTKLNKAFVDTALVAARASQRRQAENVVQARVGSISQFADAMESASRNVDVFARRLDTIGQIIEGSFSSISTRSLSEDIGTFGLPNNKRFAQGTDELLQPFGDLASPFKNQLKSFDSIASVLPQALLEGTSKFTEGRETGDVITEAIKAQLSPEQTQGEDFKATLNLFKSQFSDLFKLENLRGKLQTGDVGGITKDALKIFDVLKAPLVDLAKTFDAENQRINGALLQFRQTQEKIGQIQDKAADLSLDRDRAQADILSRDRGVKASDILGTRSSFGPKQSRLLEGTGLGNTDVRGIGQALQQTNQEILALEEKRQQPGNAGNTDLTKNLVVLQQRAGNLNKALQNLTDTSARASAIQARLSDLQQRQEGRENLTEKLFTGGPEEIQKLLQGLNNAGKFRQLDEQGQARFAANLPAEQLRGLLAAAEGIKSEKGFGNLRAEILNALNRAVGLPNFAVKNGEQKGLEADLLKVQQDAIDAQIALKDATVNAAGRQEEAINKLIEELKTGRQIQQASLERNALLGKQAPLEQQKANAELIQKTFGDISGKKVKELASEDNIKKLQQIGQLDTQAQDLSNKQPGFAAFNRLITGVTSKETRFVDAGGDAPGSNVEFSKISKDKLESSLIERLGEGNKDIVDAFIKQQTIKGLFQEKDAVGSAKASEQARKDLSNLIHGRINDNTAQAGGLRNKLGIGDAQIGPEVIQALQNKEFVNGLNNGPLSANITALTTQIDTLKQSIFDLTLQMKVAAGFKLDPGVEQAFGPQGFARGGSVFKPKGTDTIPAMLTPGEFVVNAKATAQHKELLSSINAGTFASGGLVKYFADGGINPLTGRPRRNVLAIGGNNNPFQGQFAESPEEAIARIIAQGNAPKIDQLVNAGNNAQIANTEPALAQINLAPFLRQKALGNLRAQQFAASNQGFGAIGRDISLQGQLALRQQGIAGELKNPLRNILVGGGRQSNIGGRRSVGPVLSQTPEAIAERERRNAAGVPIRGFINGNINPLTGKSRRVAAFADGGSVPSMVSPGESYTGNAQIGAAINGNRVAYLATGGQAGGSAGDNSGVAVGDFSKLQAIFGGFASSSEALTQSMTTFNANSQRLSEALSAFPHSVSMEGRHTVEVIINGADAFTKMQPAMEEFVTGKINEGIRNLVKDKFPDAGTVGL